MSSQNTVNKEQMRAMGSMGTWTREESSKFRQSLLRMNEKNLNEFRAQAREVLTDQKQFWGGMAKQVAGNDFQQWFDGSKSLFKGATKALSGMLAWGLETQQEKLTKIQIKQKEKAIKKEEAALERANRLTHLETLEEQLKQKSIDHQDLFEKNNNEGSMAKDINARPVNNAISNKIVEMMLVKDPEANEFLKSLVQELSTYTKHDTEKSIEFKQGMIEGINEGLAELEGTVKESSINYGDQTSENTEKLIDELKENNIQLDASIKDSIENQSVIGNKDTKFKDKSEKKSSELFGVMSGIWTTLRTASLISVLQWIWNSSGGLLKTLVSALTSFGSFLGTTVLGKFVTGIFTKFLPYLKGLSVLAAFYGGWKIGEYLNKEFVEPMLRLREKEEEMKNQGNKVVDQKHEELIKDLPEDLKGAMGDYLKNNNLIARNTDQTQLDRFGIKKDLFDTDASFLQKKKVAKDLRDQAGLQNQDLFSRALKQGIDPAKALAGFEESISTEGMSFEEGQIAKVSGSLERLAEIIEKKEKAQLAFSEQNKLGDSAAEKAELIRKNNEDRKSKAAIDSENLKELGKKIDKSAEAASQQNTIIQTAVTNASNNSRSPIPPASQENPQLSIITAFGV